MKGTTKVRLRSDCSTTSVRKSADKFLDYNKSETVIYEKILRPRGMMKLGAICCHADVINYGSLPYTDFIRTETLCQGGKLCNFRFVRHETDAGDGWERSQSI